MVRTMAGRERRQVPARTFPAALPWFRLDRIYVRGFKVEHARSAARYRSGRKLSDHAPIVANLKLAG
jgi:endonuclease/exonuclease/phosphatase family metal-dependent hydrolase